MKPRLDRELEHLIRGLVGPGAEEISCERCFETLDLYVEAELRGEDPEFAVPGMQAHLEGCAACSEDRAGLLALAAGGTRAGGSPWGA